MLFSQKYSTTNTYVEYFLTPPSLDHEEAINILCMYDICAFLFQTTPVGRGRGYASRNRDLRRPGNLIIPNDNHGLVGTSLKTSPNMTSVNVQSPPTNASEQMFSNPSSLVKIAKATSPPTKHLNLSQTVPTMNKQSAGSVPPYYQNYRCDDDDNVDENTQSVLQIDEKYSYLIQQVLMLLYCVWIFILVCKKSLELNCIQTLAAIFCSGVLWSRLRLYDIQSQFIEVSISRI